jgi:ABC-2 type transport system ATP-binding protein
MRPFRRRLAGNLSGGMKQKLQLICALIHTPRGPACWTNPPMVWIRSAAAISGAFSTACSKGVAILVTTAYLDEAERCNRIGLMDRGRLIGTGQPRNGSAGPCP